MAKPDPAPTAQVVGVADDSAPTVNVQQPSARVRCLVQGAGAKISGVRFAPVKHGDPPKAIHVSELISEDRAKKFCRQPEHFALIKLTADQEKEHAENLVKAAAPKAGQASPPDAKLVKQVADAAAANAQLLKEQQALREQVAQLTEENAKQKDEIRQLKAQGLRVAPPPASPTATGR
jgi:hypothetical protein